MFVNITPEIPSSICSGTLTSYQIYIDLLVSCPLFLQFSAVWEVHWTIDRLQLVPVAVVHFAVVGLAVMVSILLMERTLLDHHFPEYCAVAAGRHTDHPVWLLREDQSQTGSLANSYLVVI